MQKPANTEAAEAGDASSDMEIAFERASKDTNAQVTLLSMMKQNNHALILLKMTGNYWPPEYDIQRNLISWETIHVVWFLVCRVAVVLVIAFSLYFFSEEVRNDDLVGIAIAFTFFLDAASVLPTQYLNQARLQNIVFSHDCSVFEQCNTVAARFFFLCIFSLAVSVNSGSLMHQYPVDTFLLSMGELSIALYLVFNLWFLMLDLNVSSRLIDELIAQCDTRQLTLDRFNIVRGDIHSRVRKSKWASDFILVPCVASIIAILILAFHLKPTGVGVLYALGWWSAICKEMVFICVAFVYVAQVNYKADLLTEKLSCTLWTSPVDATYTSSAIHNNIHDGATSSTADQESLLPQSQDREIERLTMCVSSLTKPISFTLLFKRVSWQNVLVSGVGLTITLCVGLLRSILFA